MSWGDSGFGHSGEPNREAKLAPNKLIGFRRFGVALADRTLGAVACRNRTAVPGENTAVHYGFLGSTGHDVSGLVTTDSDGWYKAFDNVPLEGCTCGFYGYYTPELIDDTFNSNAWTCCAVVEVWGKVILGTKGFRTEKMKILGVVPPDELRSMPARVTDPLLGYGGYTYISSRSNYRDLVNQRLSWQDIVNKYGVTEYRSVADMVAAHPPQDVSHLLPRPKPVPMHRDPVDGYSSFISSLQGWHQFRWTPSSYYTSTPSWNFLQLYHMAPPGEPLPADHKIVQGCTCHWCEGARKIQKIAEDAMKEADE